MNINDRPPTNQQPVPRIEFRNVSLAYDDLVVLDDVSFKVWPAELLLLVGESGGGKSTVIRLALGLDKTDSGVILIEGEDITRLDEDELDRVREKMGVVFQEGALFDSLSVFDNVAYRLEDHGQDQPTIQRKVGDILKFVGLDDVADKLPAELSGGMKRRVAIARALAAQPEAILYDEPTTMVDPIMSDHVGNLMLRLKRQLKLTGVVVTHDLELMRKVADTVVVLHEGKAIYFGPVADLEKSTHPHIQEFLAMDRVA